MNKTRAASGGPVVRLIAIDADTLETIVTRPEEFAARYGAQLGENAGVIEEVVRQTLELHERRPRAPQWGGFLLLDPALGAVVGTCGYADGPGTEGFPEIAYFTFPAYERRGYGRAMAAYLVEHARSLTDARGVIAHTLPQPGASTRILESVGLELEGEIEHAEDGIVWRWSRQFERGHAAADRDGTMSREPAAPVDEGNPWPARNQAAGPRLPHMGKGRLEAFSDGVIAILITIMVLEMKVPHGVDFAALKPVLPVFLSYTLSFTYLGIYWNNHHHMLHACREVTGSILWTNLHLLFWLSLIPFATGWMGENHFAALPCALYGAVLLMAAIAYWILQQRIIVSQGARSLLRRAVGGDWKGKLSPVLYAAAIPLAFVSQWISMALYVFVALMWIIPDRRIEHVLAGPHGVV